MHDHYNMITQAVALKWHEVTRHDFFNKNMALLVAGGLASLASTRPLMPLLNGWTDRQFDELVQGFRKRNSLFSIPLPLALKLFRADLRVPPTAFHNRLHDWVCYNGYTQHAATYFVCADNWGDLLAPFNNYPVMREAIQMHRANLDYKRTKVYTRFLALAREGKPVWRNQLMLNTEERIDDYFNRFVALFESIQAHGVLPIGSLTAPLAKQFRPSAARRWKTQWGERDIGVALGPDGELVLLPGGKHRLAVATVLKISHVPVQVRMVHVDWLKRLPRGDGQSWISAISDGIEVVRQQYASVRTSGEND
jgi:hypothetical protein